MENKRPRRQLPYLKKQTDYERETIRYAKYPHRHRHDYPSVKKRFKRMERHIAQSTVDLALLNGSAENLSNALFDSISLRLKGPKQIAVPLGELVEWRLQRRIEKHGARKRRQNLPYTPQSQPQNAI